METLLRQVFGVGPPQFAIMTSPIFDVSSMISPELLFDWSHLNAIT